MGCPPPATADDAGLPQLSSRVERVVSSGLPEPSVAVDGLLRVLDDGRVVSPLDTGAGVIGALRLRGADGTLTQLAVPPEEAGGQFSFFEDEHNYGGWHDAPARGWAVLDGGLHEYVGAGGRPRGRLPDGTVLVEVATAVRGQLRLVRWRPGSTDGGPDLVDARDSFADLAFTRFARLARNGTLFYAGAGGANGEHGEPTVLRVSSDGGVTRVDLHRFSSLVPEAPCCAVADIDGDTGALLGLEAGKAVIIRDDAVDTIDPEPAEVGRLNARGDVLYEARESRLRFEGKTWRFDPAATWGQYYPELVGRLIAQAVDMNAAGQVLLRPTAGSAFLVTPSLTEVTVPTEVLTFERVSGASPLPDPLDLGTAQVGLMLGSASLSLSITSTTGPRRALTVLVNGATVQAGGTVGLTTGGGRTASVSYVDRVVGVTAVGTGNGSVEVLSMSPARVRLSNVELSSSGARLTVSGVVSER